MTGTGPPHRQVRLLGLVFLGGATGTTARYAVGLAVPHVARLPLGTLVVNVLGAFLLGALLEHLAGRGSDTGRRRALRLTLGTGFCGGFTTYSALAVDTGALLRSGLVGHRARVRRGHGPAGAGGHRAGDRRRPRGGTGPGMTVLLLALAGGLGAVARFGLDGVVTGLRPWGHPVGTTVVNLTGSFLLGLVVGLAGAWLPGDAALVLGTGFLGGYTTFSTAAYETVRLVEQQRWGAALVHGLGQVVVATALAALGYVLGSAG